MKSSILLWNKGTRLHTQPPLKLESMWGNYDAFFTMLKFIFSDSEIIKEIMFTKSDKIEKPLEFYSVLDQLFGPNVVTTEGDAWKRHR